MKDYWKAVSQNVTKDSKPLSEEFSPEFTAKFSALMSQKIIDENKLRKARQSLRKVQQCQQDWKEYGINRVNLCFDDIESNWLDEFDNIEV